MVEQASAQSDLPSLNSIFRLPDTGFVPPKSFYDCKFYPYSAAGVDPVFAVTGDVHTLVCRPLSDPNKGFDILRWWKDEDEAASLNSLTWCRDESTADPLLCVTGKKPQIKIFNVTTGQLVRTLIGHGQNINDIATSPVSSHTLASVSEDNTLRIWTLLSKYAKQPTAVICAGDGHKAGILTVTWHHAGRYLLTGGMDTRVCLWLIPSIPNRDTGTDKPTQVYYPHFSTTQIHGNLVDCIKFHGSLILSKACEENRILLWRITGFHPDAHDLPPQSAAPTCNLEDPFFNETRSAFGSGFQVLMEFDVPGSSYYYMRFGLFTPPPPATQAGHIGNDIDTEKQSYASRLPTAYSSLSAEQSEGVEPPRHVLAMGNSSGLVSFWDLASLADSHRGPDARDERAMTGSKRGRKKGARGPSATRRQPGAALAQIRSESVVSAASSSFASSEGGSNTPGLSFDGSNVVAARLGGPFTPQMPHKSVQIRDPEFNARAVAWSVGGEWCVVAGDQTVISVFRRW